ncbi:MAG: zinc ribbon domain-containing protein [Lachnospiraceae bacterium]|nr:zinc ribbon domain-containing protein [Lachnospiraceae bacterium]
MAMNCPKCGTAVPDGAGFCTVCGTRIEAASGMTGNPSAQSILASVDPTSSLSGSTPTRIEHVSYVSSTGATGFVDPSERAICSLKNGYGLNLVAGEGWKSEDSVITNKRLYYYGDQGVISKVKQEEIVNIEDITGVSIVYFRPWIFVILGALSAMIGLATIKSVGGIICLIFGVFLLLMFVLLCKSFLKIEYAGGSIHFSVKKYGLDKVRIFQRCIFSLKDKQK